MLRRLLSRRPPSQVRIGIALCGILLFGLTLFIAQGAHEAHMIEQCETIGCMQQLLLKEEAARGLPTALGLLERIYASKPHVRGDCSKLLAAALAKSTYARDPDFTHYTITPAIATCNYGFIQQYPETVLTETGNPLRAQAFCDVLARTIGATVPGAETECYRSLGKGLALNAASTTHDQEKIASSATRHCKILAPSADSYGTCVSGVFGVMGRTASIGASGLSIDKDDPLSLCKAQSDPMIRSRCFGNYKSIALSMFKSDDVAESEKLIRLLYANTTPTEMREAFWLLGYERARTTLVDDHDIPHTLAACGKLQGDAIEACIGGVSVGLAKHGSPWNQHVLLTEFCKEARAAFPDIGSGGCPSTQAIGYIRGFYAPHDFASAYAWMSNRLGTMVPLESPVRYGY